MKFSLLYKVLCVKTKKEYAWRTANAPLEAGTPQTVLRIRTLELNIVRPRGAATLKPSFLNMDKVPWVDSLPKARDSHRVIG